MKNEAKLSLSMRLACRRKGELGGEPGGGGAWGELGGSLGGAWGELGVSWASWARNAAGTVWRMGMGEDEDEDEDEDFNPYVSHSSSHRGSGSGSGWGRITTKKPRVRDAETSLGGTRPSPTQPDPNDSLDSLSLPGMAPTPIIISTEEPSLTYMYSSLHVIVSTSTLYQVSRRL